MLISIVFILQTFTVIFVMGLIMLAVWWITDKKWAGLSQTIVIMSVEDSNGVYKYWIVMEKVMNYSVYKKENIMEKYSYANSV